MDTMLPEVTPEELAAALDATVAEVLVGVGIERPPVDAFTIAAALGIVVARDDRQSGRARYVRLRSTIPVTDVNDGQGSILLRDDPRHERRQWAVAHELGEHLATDVFARLSIDPRTAPAGSREMVANYLASRLLLPTEWLACDAEDCDWDLATLKVRYATASHELLARRMLDYPAEVIMTIFDQGGVTFRLASAGRAPSLVSLERDAWQAVHATGLMAERIEHGLRVRAWPIHEAGWKREILRTEPTECDE